MIFTLIGMVLILVLVLIAIGIGMRKEKSLEVANNGIIHSSGIYSIIRKSPREALTNHKPSEKEISDYLLQIREDIENNPLSEKDFRDLILEWNNSLTNSVEVIEKGDRKGVDFYYYDYPKECPVCKTYLSKGQFIRREEIFHYPSIIPPFHLGCTCRIVPHIGKATHKTTIDRELRPFFSHPTPPPLPKWRLTVKPQVPDATSHGMIWYENSGAR